MDEEILEPSEEETETDSAITELDTDIELPEGDESDDSSKNYHIFIRTIERPNDNSLWAIYKNTDEDGRSTVYSTDSGSELDTEVEKLINTTDGMIRPKDILVADVIPWTADATSDYMLPNLELTDETSIDDIVDDIVDDVLNSADVNEATEQDINNLIDDISDNVFGEDGYNSGDLSSDDDNSDNSNIVPEDLSPAEESEDGEKVIHHYHIMVRVAQRPNVNSLWKLLKVADASTGENIVFNTTDYDVLNVQVESMINVTDGKYKPKDIMIISIDEWEVDAVSEVMANNVLLASETEISDLVDELAEEILNSQEEPDEPDEPDIPSEDNTATTEDIDNLVDDLLSDLGL